MRLFYELFNKYMHARITNDYSKTEQLSNGSIVSEHLAQVDVSLRAPTAFF